MPTLSTDQERLRKNNSVQSVLFDRKKYSIPDVCVILRYMGYNCFYIDTTPNEYRVRQFNPGLNKDPGYFMDQSTKFPGVQFVIEYPR